MIKKLTKKVICAYRDRKGRTSPKTPAGSFTELTEYFRQLEEREKSLEDFF